MILLSIVGTEIAFLHSLSDGFVRAYVHVSIITMLGIYFLPVIARLGISVGTALLLSDIADASLLDSVVHGVIVGLLIRILLGLVQWQADIVAHSTGLKSLGEHGTLFETVYLYAVIAKFFSLDSHFHLVNALAKCDYACISAASAFGLVLSCVNNAWQICLPILAVGLSLQIVVALFNRMIPQVPVFFISQPFVLIVGMLCLPDVLKTHSQLVYDSINRL